MTIAQLESLATWSGTQKEREREFLVPKTQEAVQVSVSGQHTIALSHLETWAGHLIVWYVSRTDGWSDTHTHKHTHTIGFISVLNRFMFTVRWHIILNDHDHETMKFSLVAELWRPPEPVQSELPRQSAMLPAKSAGKGVTNQWIGKCPVLGIFENPLNKSKYFVMTSY